MTENPARQPQGIPTGGQYAATSHTDPDITLAGSSAPSGTSSNSHKASCLSAAQLALEENWIDLHSPEEYDASYAELASSFEAEAFQALSDGTCGCVCDRYGNETIRHPKG